MWSSDSSHGKIDHISRHGDRSVAYTLRGRSRFAQSQDEELLEVACHEDNGDLQHLKDVRDEYRAKQAEIKKEE